MKKFVWSFWSAQNKSSTLRQVSDFHALSCSRCRWKFVRCCGLDAEKSMTFSLSVWWKSFVFHRCPLHIHDIDDDDLTLDAERHSRRTRRDTTVSRLWRRSKTRKLFVPPIPRVGEKERCNKWKKELFLIFYFHGGGRVSSTQHDSLVRRETELNSTNKKKYIKEKRTRPSIMFWGESSQPEHNRPIVAELSTGEHEALHAIGWIDPNNNTTTEKKEQRVN